MERDPAKEARLPGWVSNLLQNLVAKAGRIGFDRTDSSEISLQKRLAVLLFVGTIPMTVMWALVYLAAGAPLAASIPGVYSIVTPINTAAFGWTRNLNFYRFSQLLMTLFLPWAVMVSLGGFSELTPSSSGRHYARSRRF